MSNAKYNPILISNIPDKLTKTQNGGNYYVNPDFYNGKYEYYAEDDVSIFFKKSDCNVNCALSYTNGGEFIAEQSDYYGRISIYLCTEEYDDSDKYGAVSYTDGGGFLIFFKNKNTGKYLFIDPTTVDDDYIQDMYDPDKHELFSFQNLNKTPINLNNYDLEIWTENYKIAGNNGNVTNYLNTNKLLRFLGNRSILAHYVNVLPWKSLKLSGINYNIQYEDVDVTGNTIDILPEKINGIYKFVDSSIFTNQIGRLTFKHTNCNSKIEFKLSDHRTVVYSNYIRWCTQQLGWRYK